MTITPDANSRAYTPPALPERVTELPLCNKSINSRAAVIHEIRRRELEHWYSGLRQAELFMDEKTAALEAFVFDCREYELGLQEAELKISELEKKQSLTPKQRIKLSRLQNSIDLSSRRLFRIRAEVRDAMMEFAAAKGERDRILQEHPEALHLSYDEMQERFTAPMLQERQARYIAARVWAAQNGLPDGVGESVFSVPLEQREALLIREAELRRGSSLTEAKVRALETLSHLPSEEQTQALLLTAQHINAYQQTIQQQLKES